MTRLLRFLILLLVAGNGVAMISQWKSVTPRENLAQRRAVFHTAFNGNSYTPNGKPLIPPENVYELVRYPSAVGMLAAYITPAPMDKAKRPAIIWAHGGLGGISDTWDPDNDQNPRTFLNKDFVLMCPSWRHENDNPGTFQLFLGEVDDLLAAVQFLRTLSYVDSDRIYIVGYSVGGTLALLAAETTNTFRAAFCIGGTTDMTRYFADGKGDGPVPFDLKNREEIAVRDPMRFIHSLSVPTFYFEGGNAWEAPAACKMEMLAKNLGRPFHTVIVAAAHHWSVLQPSLVLIADKIRADTGKDCDIKINVDEMREIYTRMPQPQQVFED